MKIDNRKLKALKENISADDLLKICEYHKKNVKHELNESRTKAMSGNFEMLIEKYASFEDKDMIYSIVDFLTHGPESTGDEIFAEAFTGIVNSFRRASRLLFERDEDKGEEIDESGKKKITEP